MSLIEMTPVALLRDLAARIESGEILPLALEIDNELESPEFGLTPLNFTGHQTIKIKVKHLREPEGYRLAP